MTENLLLPAGGVIAISALAAVGGIAVLYGALKKFSRMGWMGWQIAVVFAFTLLLRFLPAFENKTLYFAVTAGACLLVAVLVLTVGAGVRSYMRSRRVRAPLPLRILDRLLGAVTALFDWALLLVIFGGAALGLVWYGTDLRGGVFDIIFSFTLGGVNVWSVVSGYVYDLLLVSLFVIVVKGGYRLGLVKSLWVAAACLLTLAAFFGSLFIALRVPFASALAVKIAGAVPGNALIGGIIGYGAVTLICFVLISVVLTLLGVLVNFLVKKLDGVKPFRVIDGAILSVLLFAVTVAAVCAGNFGVYALTGLAEGEAGAAVAGMVQGLQDFVCSSPLSRVFYECNPVLLLAGG